MCGIIFTPVKGVLHSMMVSISHRGSPGRNGMWCDEGICIGHLRLPIQGLDKENDQPWLMNNDVLAFNGEIFNYKDLMPTASCDTKVLGELYPVRGKMALDQFDGFWSFLYHDQRTNFVEAVTDPLGKKPLYIHLPTLSIASEIKSLSLLDERLDFDDLYFSGVAKWGYHIGDRTFLKTVRKLPPGSITTVDVKNRTYSSKPWVELKARKGVDLRKEIEIAVNNRLVSDVPIALLVSGGLDSSIIYKLVERKTHNFTVIHVDNGEEEYLNHLEIPSDIEVIKIRYNDIDIKEVLYYNEGPVDLGSMLPQYAMGKAIKSQCPDTPVIITGDGADELFGGYRRMSEYDAQHSDVFEELVYYHLPRLDKLSMAHTLELRSPFLARPVIEGALSLPYEDRIEKRYLKRLFEDVVPKSIIDRKKHPLKSTQVLEGGMEWRLGLIKKFKDDVVSRYFTK